MIKSSKSSFFSFYRKKCRKTVARTVAHPLQTAYLSHFFYYFRYRSSIGEGAFFIFLFFITSNFSGVPSIISTTSTQKNIFFVAKLSHKYRTNTFHPIILSPSISWSVFYHIGQRYFKGITYLHQNRQVDRFALCHPCHGRNSNICFLTQFSLIYTLGSQGYP